MRSYGKTMLTSFVAALLIGCQGQNVTIPSTGTPQQGTKVQASTQSTQETKKEEPKQDDRRKKPFNSDRRFQLNDLEIINIKINGKTYKTWVMDTPGKLEEGMMYVFDKDVMEDEAMIFIYNESQELNFWMRNTRIPLDIAYVTPKKVIHHQASMKAYDESPVPSRGPVQYAIEFKVGVLKKHGIKTGMKVDMPDGLKLKIDAGLQR